MSSGNLSKISKPFIIRAVGWVAFFLFLWVPAMKVAQWLTGYQFQYFPFFAYLALLVSLPLLIIWMFASIGWKIAQRHAMITAAGLMRAMREEKVRQEQRGQ